MKKADVLKNMDPAASPPGDVTRLLLDWQQGDRQALDELIDKTYDQLRRAAAFYFQAERPDHTLQPTALIHEVFLRLSGDRSLRFTSRSQFFWFAGRLMRCLLVEHARSRAAAKRGGGNAALPAGLVQLMGRNIPLDRVVSLHEALEKLAAIDPVQGKVVELRFFAGLDVPEVAALLNVSESTVKREWRTARYWLARHLKPET